jgi:hypothetical protein
MSIVDAAMTVTELSAVTGILIGRDAVTGILIGRDAVTGILIGRDAVTGILIGLRRDWHLDWT